MASLEKEMEHRFFTLLNAYLQESSLAGEYSIVQEPVLKEYTSDPRFKNYRPDFVILKGSFPYLIIEVNSNLNRKVTRDYLQTSSFILELTGADYFIITDLEQSYTIGDTELEAAKPYGFETIYKYFKSELAEDTIRTKRKQIVEYIKEEILPLAGLRPRPTYFGPSVDTLLSDAELEDKIAYNKDGRFYYFRTDPNKGLEDFEHQLFQSILDPLTDEAVCRYTTQESLFAMLNHKTYRMGSHLAMNDRGEIDYVDKYLKINYKPIHNLSLDEMKSMNESFISSCSTVSKKDDLTMYRLYGDDTKGVCLRFSVSLGVQSRYMIVRKISYAMPDGTHPELDVLMGFLVGLSTTLKVRFRFMYLDVWKHFFKTKDYRIEDEVRLLYLNNKTNPPGSQGWVVTHPDKIVSKYVMFDLNSTLFPLQLTDIILGPNYPEPHVNKRQLEVLIDEKGIPNVVVANSKIESYRKS